jgi:hypothetical protein
MRTDWCVYDRWAQNMRGDEKRWGIRRWEPIGVSIAGGPYTSCRLPSAPIGSEIEGFSTPIRRVVIPFSQFLFLMKGKTVNV